MVYVVLSLLTGLASWKIALLNLKNKDHKKGKYYIILSFSFCLLSIYSQILLMFHYGEENWSLIIDTLGALEVVLPVLILVTIILNLLCVYIQNQKKE